MGELFGGGAQSIWPNDTLETWGKCKLGAISWQVQPWKALPFFYVNLFPWYVWNPYLYFKDLKCKMIKKYNRIFVNLSAIAGDIFAASLFPLLCEQGSLCLLLSFAVIWGGCRFSVLFTIFRFSLGSRLPEPFCTLGRTNLGNGSQTSGWDLDPRGGGAKKSHSRIGRGWRDCNVFSLSWALPPCPTFLPRQVKKGPGKQKQNLALGPHSRNREFKKTSPLISQFHWPSPDLAAWSWHLEVI